MDANSSNQQDHGQQRSEFVEVKPKDVAALRDWATRWCRGWTVSDLAAALKVEPTRDAVVGYLSEGLKGEARQVVIEVCERELARGDSSSD